MNRFFAILLAAQAAVLVPAAHLSTPTEQRETRRPLPKPVLRPPRGGVLLRTRKAQLSPSRQRTRLHPHDGTILFEKSFWRGLPSSSDTHTSNSRHVSFPEDCVGGSTVASKVRPPPTKQPTRVIGEEYDDVCRKSQQIEQPSLDKEETPPSNQNTFFGLSRLDVAMLAAYFCNMFALNLSVVTMPALVTSQLSCGKASASFQASVASLAPLGGAVGKLVNGFVCQRLGGRLSSGIYLLGVAIVSMGLSCTRSLQSIGLILMLFEFLSSIQWTSMCTLMDHHYRGSPELMTRGIALLSLSSYFGALAAKTIGGSLLNLTAGNWRLVTQCGAFVSLIGAFSIYLGTAALVPTQAMARRRTVGETVAHVAASVKSMLSDRVTGPKAPAASPLDVLKSILGSRVFWMIGIGHSVAYLIRGCDRLLVPFLHEATTFSREMCGSLTSGVTIGLVLGLRQGARFQHMDSVEQQMDLLRKNYMKAFLSVLGLGACALITMYQQFQAPYLMAIAISALSTVAASCISFQFSQFPNLISSTVFPENKAVALSLVDAAGFFITSQVLSANSKVLSSFGWSASWSFLALFSAFGAILMMNTIEPVLARAKRNVRRRPVF